MLMMKRSYISLFVYKKELGAVIGIMITALIGISLYSYHPYDPSWFYLSSSPQSIHNLCGVVGVQLAALLIFLFGSAVYLLVPLLALFSYWLGCKRNWRYEWERVAAGAAILIFVAALCAMHGITMIYAAAPGGYVGYMVTAFLFHFLDRIGSLLFLYTGLYAFLVLLFRFSFMSIVHDVAQGARNVYLFVRKYCVVQRIYLFFKTVIWVI